MDNGLSILIAEDDDNDALILERALRKAGFENPFHVVKDGAEALAYLRAESQYADRKTYPFPRVLITDLKMPGMDGLELLEWLQKHPHCNVIPTIVLSASNQQSDIVRAYQLGANAYMVKPGNYQRLADMMKLTLEYWQVCEKPEVPTKC